MNEIWTGRFGDAYTERNRVFWRNRLPFWRTIVNATGARFALEVGCNSGWNLLCLRELGVHCSGLEPNVKAAMEAEAHGFAVWRTSADICHILRDSNDLVFTAGVLIHVSSDEIRYAMRGIAHASRKWVLAVEYEADREEEIEYRGQKHALWKRPFGRMYEDLGLTLVETGEAEGFDRCTYWLMEKP